jgi:Holliday junction resolvasome RuvABC DNA-binding subunit
VGLPAYYGRKSDPVANKPAENDEALEALMALGLNLADATKALENIDQTLPVEERIRQALKAR